MDEQLREIYRCKNYNTRLFVWQVKLLKQLDKQAEVVREAIADKLSELMPESVAQILHVAKDGDSDAQ